MSPEAHQYLTQVREGIRAKYPTGNVLAVRFDGGQPTTPVHQELYALGYIKMAGLSGAGWFLTQAGYAAAA